MLCDVLLVGAGTLRQESYGPVRLDQRRRDWRRDAGLAEHPTLAVVSSRLELDPFHRAFADAPVRPIVFTHAGSPLERRDRLATMADVIVVGDAEVDLAAARRKLIERGLTQMLSEGGPHLFGSLLAAGAVDELCLTVAPLLAGPGAGRIVAGPSALRHTLRLAHVLEAEGNLLVRYTR
jgi:riboflavin biosynthesis pyrimidine reductase